MVCVAEAGMKTHAYRIALILILLLGLYLRAAGLLRGLAAGHVFHPDAPKQTQALSFYLQNRYLWYFNSPFFDGYPFGLNHLDEWICRTAYQILRPIHAVIQPGSTPLPYPAGSALLYWTAALRLLYGMAALALAALAARRLLPQPAPRLAALLALALAPLAFNNTHFATGDVGLDLFTAAMILMLAHYVERRQAIWIAFAGFCCGLAFAVKYQGLLTFGAVAALLVAEWFFLRSDGRDCLRKMALSVVALASGAVTGTPALLLNFRRTWRDMRNNFVFLQNYGVPPAYLDRPFTDRLRHGLTHNLPEIAGLLGWIMLALALAALVALTIRLARRRAAAAPDTDRCPALIWALAVFLPAALLLATLLKPMVQPFHFSYLQWPACLAGAWTLAALAAAPRRAARLAALGLGLLAIGEFIPAAARETFFWSRQDTGEMAQAFAQRVFRNPLPTADRGPNRQALKYFFLEAANPAVFRNKPYKVLHPDPMFWNRLGIAPLPTVPLLDDPDWIFINGPVFPRSDRLFPAPPDQCLTRELVYYQEPARDVALGIRSGPDPVEVTLQLGGTTAVRQLAPNTQVVLHLRPRSWRTLPCAAPENGAVHIVPLRVRARLGAAWINVLDRPEEIAHFQLFGGEAPVARAGPGTLPPRAELLAQLAQTAFVDLDRPRPLPIRAEPAPLFASAIPLPAGVYTLECVLRAAHVPDRITLECMDPAHPGEHTPPAGALWAPRQSFILTADVQVVRFTFAKYFAPYVVNIAAANEHPTAASELVDARLYPAAATLLDDLERFQTTGTRPEWCARGPRPASVREQPVAGVTFGRALDLTALAFPDVITAGQSFEYAFRFAVRRYHIPHFSELVVFVHLENEAGELAATFDFPIRLAGFNDGPVAAVAGRIPSSLPAGRYRLTAGVYNSRTELRLPAQVAHAAGYRADDDAVELRTVTVQP